MDYHNLLKLGIYWGPTLLFVLIILISFLVGFIRGLRKSFILAMHALACFAVCIVLYLFLVSSNKADELMVTIPNLFLGKDGLQNLLGVNASCKTLRECILEYIPRQMDFMDGLELILRDNGQYILTIVDMVYRIVWGVVVYIIYLLSIFILSIVYFFAYPSRKAKKKTNQEFLDGRSMTTYHKKKLYGGLIGIGRGLVHGLVWLSFIGMIFYIVAGGLGEREETNLETPMEEIDYVVDAYDAIGSYGTKGIYKILNMCKDRNDVPYYLYACDLVFQGRLTDPDLGVTSTKNVYLRKELANYTELSRNTIDLLLKYGGDEIKDMVFNGTDDAWAVIYPILNNKDFQIEFKNVINKFDENSYFINLTFSLAQSIVKHMDELSLGLDDEMADLLQILFKEGYHSNVIPYEKSLKEGTQLPTLNSSVLLTKGDLQSALDIFFVIVGDINEPIDDVFMYSLNTTQKIMPYIYQLSLFKTSYKDKLNPVLARLYAWTNYQYLDISEATLASLETEPAEDTVTDEEIEESKQYYISEYYSNIDWVDEIDSLFAVCNELAGFLNREKDNLPEEYDFITISKLIIASLDNENENYKANLQSLDHIVYYLANSKLLGEVLSTKTVTSTIVSSIASVGGDYAIPNTISYPNKYDENGKFIEYGETYYLFNLIRALAVNNMLEDVITMMDADVVKMSEILDLIDELNVTEYKDVPLMDYLLSSSLINSMITSSLTSNSFGDVNISVPKELLVEYSNGAKTIEINEYKLFFKYFPTLIRISGNLFEDQSSANIQKVLKDERLDETLKSKLIENTLSQILIDNLYGIDGITISDALKAGKYNITTDERISEIKAIIKVIRDYNIDLEKVMDGNLDDVYNLLDEAIDSRVKFNDVYISNVLAASISSNLDDSVKEYQYAKVIKNSSIYDKDSKSYETNEIYNTFYGIKHILGINIIDIIKSDKVDTEIDKAKDKILVLSEDEVNKLWTSYYMAGLLSCQLDDVLTSDSIDAKGIDSQMHDPIFYKTDNDLLHYTDTEVYLFKESIKDGLGITKLSGDVTVTVDDFLALYDPAKSDTNQPKIDAIYSSSLSTYLVKNRLDDILMNNSSLGLSKSQIADSRVLENSSATHSYPIYTKKEVTAFLKNINVVFDVKTEEDLDNLQYEKVMHDLTNDQIDIIYESHLCTYVLSNQLDDIFTKDYLSIEVRDHEFVKDSFENNKYYYIDEVKAISAANKSFEFFGEDGSFNTPTQSLLKSKSEEERNKLYASYVILGIMTKSLDDEVLSSTGGFVAKTDLAFMEGIKVYHPFEIDVLIDTFTTSDDDSNIADDLLIVDLQTCLEEKNGRIKSYLMYSSISKYILESTELILLKEVKCTIGNTTFVELAEVKALLNSIKKLGLVELGDIAQIQTKAKLPSDVDSLKEIFESQLLRSTLPSYIVITYSSLVLRAEALLNSGVLDDYTLINNKGIVVKPIKVIQKDEFAVFLHQLLTLAGSSESSLSFTVPDSPSSLFTEEYDALSSTYLVFISNILSGKSYSYMGVPISIDFSTASTYVLSTYVNKINAKLITKDSYNYIKSIAGYIS